MEINTAGITIFSPFQQKTNVLVTSVITLGLFAIEYFAINGHLHSLQILTTY
jgi:hypothetical protein